MTWTPDQLDSFHTEQELTLILTREGHETVRVPVWMVRVGDEVFLRSQRGPTSVWFRRVMLEGDQEVELAGDRMPVRFEHVGPLFEHEIGEAYRTKYAGDRFPEDLLEEPAVGATVRLDRR